MKSIDNVLVPQYNKSLRGGRGDRETESQWINATGKKFRKEEKNCIMRKKVSYYKTSVNRFYHTKKEKKNRESEHRRERLKLIRTKYVIILYNYLI